MEENWVVCREFLDYEISDCGRVRRLTSRGPAKAGSYLQPRKNRCGYLQVHLSAGPNGSYTRTVHRLVACAFHGDPPFSRAQVAHYDGDKTNNRASNLRWATVQENAEDSIRLGRLKVGAAHPKASLTDAALVEIRRAKEAGERTDEIAARLGVCTSTVNRLYRHGTWAALAPKDRALANHRIGQLHHKAKLTDDDVRAIRRGREEGLSIDRMAAQFGVSRAQISSICTRRTWKHLEGAHVQL